jgi:RimJ/RimL family protein N-acetyltransferase/ribosomal protein S18 acetylase RimI-like enzyme
MPVERIRAFRHHLERGMSERRVACTLGEGLFADSIPNVYDHNFLSIESTSASAAEVAQETETLMESYFHRRVVLERGDDALSGALLQHGFVPSRHLVMLHAREPDRIVDTSPIHEVPFERLEIARTAAILREPWGDEEIARQLNGAKRLIGDAVPTRYFAAILDGEVAAYCELRSDGGVAQIEDVETIHAYRGRGLGRAIVQHALLEAKETNEVVFLEALADDWPRLLYGKLGFDVVDQRDFLTRLPHPLTRLRLRTPRLELRLATIAELRRLFDVAAAGIHDPDVMPFSVAWTDNLNEDDFIAYHRSRLDDATPVAWELALVVFVGEQPVGVQSIENLDFQETGALITGSWLGQPYQGLGYGTEMRNAVLTFLFEKLGADEARSGAIEGNPASLGVSRKLGYTQVGMSVSSPRGVPVPHADLSLQREQFRRTVPVEIVGFDPATLPWFGVQP